MSSPNKRIKRRHLLSYTSLKEAPTHSYSFRSRLGTMATQKTSGRTSSKMLTTDKKDLECRYDESSSIHSIGDKSRAVIENPDGVESIEDIYVDDTSLLDVRYVTNHVRFIKRLEERRCLPKDFLCDEKAVVSTKMRAVIIDWLIQVQNYLGLLQETLYLSVNIIDRYFACRASISMGSLQLLVISAVFISCKVEERFAPKVKKLIHLTDDSYVYEDVIGMEKRILTALDFNLNFANPVPFVCHCVKVAKCNKTVSVLSYYLIDLILHDVRSTQFFPSVMAASAVYLARRILSRENNSAEWNLTLQFYSGYMESALQPVAALMSEVLIALPSTSFQAARNKYASMSRYQGLSHSPLLSPNLIKSLVIHSDNNDPKSPREK